MSTSDRIFTLGCGTLIAAMGIVLLFGRRDQLTLGLVAIAFAVVMFARGPRA